MKRHVRISTEPINEAALQAERQASAGAGAVVYFIGLVRGDRSGSGNRRFGLRIVSADGRASI